MRTVIPFEWFGHRRGQRMMGRQGDGQGRFFYAFDLDEVVPVDHLVRQIDAVLDLSWVHNELAPYYSHTGRPSIDPVLMIRMLIVGYVFATQAGEETGLRLKTMRVVHDIGRLTHNHITNYRCRTSVTYP